MPAAGTLNADDWNTQFYERLLNLRRTLHYLSAVRRPAGARLGSRFFFLERPFADDDCEAPDPLEHSNLTLSGLFQVRENHVFGWPGNLPATQIMKNSRYKVINS